MWGGVGICQLEGMEMVGQTNMWEGIEKIWVNMEEMWKKTHPHWCQKMTKGKRQWAHLGRASSFFSHILFVKFF
jgi:hypothetical protein